MALLKKEAYFGSKTGRVTEAICKAASNKPADFFCDLKTWISGFQRLQIYIILMFILAKQWLDVD